MDDRIFINPHLWHLWTWCLMKANHQNKTWDRIGKGSGYIEISVDRGSFVFGRHTAARELKINPNTIWKRIKKLEKLDFLAIKSNNQYSVVTIRNYEVFRNSANSKATSEGTRTGEERERNGRGTGEERNTTKNVKNVKNENNVKNKELKTNTFCSNSGEIRLAELLFSLILKNNPEHKTPDLQKWAKVIDLMIRIDERFPAQIEEIIIWCQQDHEPDPDKKWNGWAAVILSPGNLRKQYNTLFSRMTMEKRKREVSEIPESARGPLAWLEGRRKKNDRE